MITYHRTQVDGLEVFYREAGSKNLPTVILLHGFPSSSHMFRDLIPRLAGDFHVVAPDYIGFGYSAQPPATEFQYTFDNLAAHVEKLLFDKLHLAKFAIYVQDYGAPVGFRLASGHPEAISAIVVQNGNAYVEGLSPAWASLRALWANRTADTEQAVRAFLAPETTRFQYTEGVGNVEEVSPDAYTFDQLGLDRPGNDAIQISLFHDYASNLALYPQWHAYFREHQPPMLIVWGKNDPFFTVEGAKAFQRDLPEAELHLLDTGHFALEDKGEFMAQQMRRFLRDVVGQGTKRKTA
ncbi:MAG TPA: alpha/beta hydrolase [Bryobacteraceae bacterium]|nr:alpha/beta hydrolase [Bryobacteraceae bacterium]